MGTSLTSREGGDYGMSFLIEGVSAPAGGSKNVCKGAYGDLTTLSITDGIQEKSHYTQNENAHVSHLPRVDGGTKLPKQL